MPFWSQRPKCCDRRPKNYESLRNIAGERVKNPEAFKSHVRSTEPTKEKFLPVSGKFSSQSWHRWSKNTNSFEPLGFEPMTFRLNLRFLQEFASLGWITLPILSSQYNGGPSIGHNNHKCRLWQLSPDFVHPLEQVSN